MKKFILLLFSMVILASFVYADSISIEAVRIEPKEIEPGNTAKITLELQNQGDKDLKGVKVALDLSSVDLPFIPVDSAAQKIIDKINEDDFESISFTLTASPDAAPKIYKIPIIISYIQNDILITQSSVIGLEVKSLPILEVAIEENEIYKLNQQGEITIRFVNKGLGSIKFLSVKLSKNKAYEILSSDSFYVGNIDPDDFETVNFKLNFNSKLSKLPIQIEYRDSNNKLYKKSYELPITLYTQEEAYKLGLDKKTNPFTYIIIAIVIIVLIFIFRRRKRKKLNK